MTFDEVFTLFRKVLLAKATLPEARDGQLSFGKNPRRLQFIQKRGTEEKLFEFWELRRNDQKVIDESFWD